MPSDSEMIARGGNPVWERTYKHPEHGELTFRAKLPKSTDLLRQSIEIDRLMTQEGFGYEGDIRGGTSLLLSAIAGLRMLVELPVISEERIEVDDEHEKVITHRYDPGAEPDEDFLATLWIDFSKWRGGLLEKVEEVQGFSEGTDGNKSSSTSTGTTPSPQAS